MNKIINYCTVGILSYKQMFLNSLRPLVNVQGSNTGLSTLQHIISDVPL